MADFLVRCECGKETTVSEWAIGAPLACRHCGQRLEPTESNTRELKRPASRVPDLRDESNELPPPPEERYRRDRKSAGREATAAAAPVSPGRSAARESRPPQMEAPAPVSAPKSSRTHCGRCGRAFRGDWDMYHRGDTILCHICANQYRGEPEVETGAETARVEQVDATLLEVPRSYRGVLDQPVLPQEDPRPVRDVRETNEMIRRWVIAAGVLTVIAVSLLLWRGALDGGGAAPRATVEQAANGPRLPRSALYMSWGIGVLVDWAVSVAALYLLLRWRDRLPFDGLMANLVHILVVVGILSFFGLSTYILPCLGGILHLVMIIYVLWEVYDLELTDFVMLAVFRFVMMPLGMVVQQFAQGAWAHYYL